MAREAFDKNKGVSATGSDTPCFLLLSCKTETAGKDAGKQMQAAGRVYKTMEKSVPR